MYTVITCVSRYICVFSLPDVNECEVFRLDQGGKLCAHACVNVPGSYQCSCPLGYKLLSDSRSCEGEHTQIIRDTAHTPSEIGTHTVRDTVYTHTHRQRSAQAIRDTAHTPSETAIHTHTHTLKDPVYTHSKTLYRYTQRPCTHTHTLRDPADIYILHLVI